MTTPHERGTDATREAEELVRLLRHDDDQVQLCFTAEAADLIESQAREIARLRSQQQHPDRDQHPDTDFWDRTSKPVE